MRLDRLLGDVEVLDVRGDPAATDVAAVTHRSSAVGPGTLFCCLPGGRTDGHLFAPEAVSAGATALLCARDLPLDVTQVVVAEPRSAMAAAAAAFHGHPSRRLVVAGVTGTNGKTTTTHLLAAVMEAGGLPAAVVGTLSAGTNGDSLGPGTTPESTDLQAALARMVAGGRAGVALEVSSHALVQHRVDSVWFAVAVFTNLSPEHLDFHGDMESYFEAKARLFDPARAAAAVVNADDPWGRLLLERARLAARPYSMADAADLVVGATESRFRWEGQAVRLRLGGSFNVANALAAAACGRELGLPAAAVAEGLSAVKAVPGRFEPVVAGQPFSVIVDYAHTPAGLEECLMAARRMAGDRRVLLVFGCGGERDTAKRPLMGEIAGRLADVAVLTSDNPRHEEPAAILDQVRAGVGRTEVLHVEPDRRAAIAHALRTARAGDVVVLAGKGHESTQSIGERALPFDDRLVATEELGDMAW